MTKQPYTMELRCIPECPSRYPDCEDNCFQHKFSVWLAVNYPRLSVTYHLDIIEHAADIASDIYNPKIPDTRSHPIPPAEQCPHWGIEHSDGMEWVCDKHISPVDAPVMIAGVDGELINILRDDKEEYLDSFSRFAKNPGVDMLIHEFRDKQKPLRNREGEPR